MPVAEVESVTQYRQGMARSATRMRAGMHVQQVRDDLRVSRMRQRRARHAGRAVVQRRHGVEQVREAARAVRQGLHAVFVAAQRVAELDLKARFDQGLDVFEVPRNFRRQGDEPDRRDRIEAARVPRVKPAA